MKVRLLQTMTSFLEQRLEQIRNRFFFWSVFNKNTSIVQRIIHFTFIAQTEGGLFLEYNFWELLEITWRFVDVLKDSLKCFHMILPKKCHSEPYPCGFRLCGCLPNPRVATSGVSSSSPTSPYEILPLLWDLQIWFAGWLSFVSLMLTIRCPQHPAKQICQPGAAMGVRRHLFLPGHFITEEASDRTASASPCNLVAGGPIPAMAGESQQRSLLYASQGPQE